MICIWHITHIFMYAYIYNIISYTLSDCIWHMYIVYTEKSNVPLTLKHPLTIGYMMEGWNRMVCKAVNHTGYVLQVRGATFIFC